MNDTTPAAGPPADHLDVQRVPRTIAELPFFASGRYPGPGLLGQCRNGAIVPTSGRELLPLVRDLSLGLSSLGMTSGDRVAILSESRPEWLFADFATLAAGAVSVPIYPTLPADQTAFILRDSGAVIVVASTAVQFEKLQSVADSLPALRAIVVMDGIDVPAEVGGVRVLSFDAVRALGHEQMTAGWGVARAFHDTARRVRPDDLATIIYTSGTTAEPKGVMLTHGNLVANIDAVLQVTPVTQEDTALSFLPLCHAFERIVAYIYLTAGISVTFAESVETVGRDLLLVRPSIMTGVPRVFEKLRARIHEKAATASAVRRAIFRWAAAVAIKRGERLSTGRRVLPALAAASAVADRLVFAKIRAGLGGRLRFAVSGSAPLAADIGRFFYGLGLPIIEGYGLTETSPVLSVVRLDRIRFGTVGPPLPGVDLKIADDGEILARGPNVMRGYYNRPEETAAVLVDGWFHTGDIGSIDDEGFLRLTDRKKDLIVTSGGKKIAPQPIEQRLRRHRLVAEAVLVGDRRHFPAALVVPDVAAVALYWGVTPDEARARLDTEDLEALFQPAIDMANQDLAQFERIKKFAVISDELTVAGGVLTPTLKVKRRVFDERYRAQIDALYR